MDVSSTHQVWHSEKGKKARQTGKEVGRQHQGIDRPRVCQVPKGSGQQRKMKKTGFGVFCGATTTPTVKGQVKMKVKE